MTQQIINTGTGPDSYTGDTVRDAFTKVNSNFTELYGASNLTSNISGTTVTATGNITSGGYFIGNGSQLTGIVASGSTYGNTNVAAYLTTYSGNVNAAYYFGNGRQLTGIVSNYSNSNVASYLPTYSGNVNAAYYFGNGRQLTGITATANLGNLSIGGATNQSIIGTVSGGLYIKPNAGNAAIIQTEFDASGIVNELFISSFDTGTTYVRTGSFSEASTTNLVLGANSATIQMNANNNTIGFNGSPNPGYTYTFSNGSLYSREFYASANFPTGYQFNTPQGDTGLSHTYQNDANGNISLVRIRHDSSVPAKFYENNTTILAGNLVVIQSNSSAGSFPNAFVQTYSTANTYAQLIWQNLSGGGAATGDIVVTSDSGNDVTNYIDMGMTGSGYDNTNPINSLGTSVDHNNGYLYVKGTDDGHSGNLTIGTIDAGTVTKIIAGGVNAGNVITTISEDGMTINQGELQVSTIGNIVAPHAASAAVGYNINIVAGASDDVTWNSNPGGDVNIQGGYGSFGDGGGGPGGQVNIIGGASSDSYPGNVHIIVGGSDWTFDYNGNVTIPGSINAQLPSTSPAPKLTGFDISTENVLANNITASSYITTGSSVKLGSGTVGASQGNYAVAIGNNAGNVQANYAISIGYVAGQYSQGLGGVAIGYDAGQYSQGSIATALGAEAGRYYQSTTATAVGTRAGNWNQGAGAIAIGKSAAENISNTGVQGFNSIAIGNSAGYITQGPGAIALGAFSGLAYQGQYSIAIGANTGRDPGGSAIQAIGNNSIILNATGSSFAGNTASAFYVTPIRAVEGVNVSLSYNTTTSEVSYSANTFISNTYVPSTTSSAGTIGQISFDGSYVYICIGSNSWKRANLSTW